MWVNTYIPNFNKNIIFKLKHYNWRYVTMSNKRIKKKRAKAVKTRAIRRNNKTITRGQEYYQNISSAYIKKMSDAQLFKAIYNAAATINERLKKIKKSEKNVTSVFKFTDLYTGIQQIEKK